MVFDTDIIIWHFRGNSKASLAVQDCETRNISTITYLELLQGSRNKRETQAIRDFLMDYSFHIIPLSENIGHRAIIYMEEYGLKIAMCLSDALIAATVTEKNEILYTGNAKHYRLVSELKLKPFRV